MKKMFDPVNTAKNIDIVLLIVRISISSLMLVHGLPKLMNLVSGEPIIFPGVLGMSSQLSLTLAVFAEVFCSILILIGLGTRLAAIPLIVTMLVAGLIIHSGDPFSVKELSLHYLLVYVALFIAGGGRFSVDGFLSAKKETGNDKKTAASYHFSNEPGN
jgi:putative oxidoreductase